MAFCDKSKLTLLSLQCSHCKKTDHEKPMCFVKYPHTWRSKFIIRQVLFNNVKSTFNKTDDNATTLSFMFVIGSHLMSVWIVDTEASDHLCSTCKFFLIYEPISRSLKTVNEPAQIIEKSMVSLCLVHSDSGIQEVILKDVMHAFDCKPCFWHCMRVDDISFDMCDCILRQKQCHWIRFWGQQDFQLHLNNTPQSHAFAANCEFKVLFDMWHWRLSHLGHTNIERLFKIINIDLKNLSWTTWCLWTVHESQADLLLLQCFYWVSDLIIRSYSFECCWTIMLTVYDSSRWFVTLTDDFTRFTWMFSWKSKWDSQAYQELCHIDEDWLFWLFFRMPSHWLWV
jgi:hypothetical protein